MTREFWTGVASAVLVLIGIVTVSAVLYIAYLVYMALLAIATYG